MDDIYNRFRSYVLSDNLIIHGDKILLSLSAGKDSMFMLDLLMKLQSEVNFGIGIFHLNHLTRDEETDKDESFIRDKSNEYNIPCYIERFDFKKNKLSDMSFEEHAREIRYSFLEKISINEFYSKIATAHNMNDNAETVLMRILSGTGVAGLKGILPIMKKIIRPVLFAEKNEIYEYLRTNNIKWREDLSNNETLYLRNHLRNIIIPSIEKRFPHAEENLNHLAAHAIENQNLLYSLTGILYPDAVTENGSSVIININPFHENIPLIKFFITRVLYDTYGLKLNIAKLNEIIRRYLIISSNRVLYENNSFIMRKLLQNGNKVISINFNKENCDINEKWEYSIPVDESRNFYIREIKKELKVSFVNHDFFILNKDKSDIIFIKVHDDLRQITIRNRRPGDRIKIETGTKKIKELMIEKKLDTITKNTIPLIVADDVIAAYLPGFVNSHNNRVSCNFHIEDDTKRILAFFFKDY